MQASQFAQRGARVVAPTTLHRTILSSVLARASTYQSNSTVISRTIGGSAALSASAIARRYFSPVASASALPHPSYSTFLPPCLYASCRESIARRHGTKDTLPSLNNTHSVSHSARYFSGDGGSGEEEDLLNSPRESMPFDVLIVGGGPAGLAASIRLKQLCAEKDIDLSVCVVEKGR